MGYNFMNFKETLKALEYLFEARLCPNLIGETGIGKTELLAQYTAERGMDLIPLQVAQLEPSDFVGLYKTTEDGRTMTCPPNWLPYKDSVKAKTQKNKESVDQLRKIFTGEVNPKGGVIFLDEINRGHEDIRQALYQLVNERRIHTYVLPDNYVVCAASNPASQGYEVNEFDDALVNRFAWIKFRPEVSETLSYLENKYGKNPVLAWVHTDNALIDYGNDDWEVDGLRYSPRILEKSIKLYNLIKKERKDFRRKLFATFMQEEKVASLLSFLETMEYITFEDVIKGSKKKDIQKLIDNKEIALLVTITTNLSDVFMNYEFGEGIDNEYFKASDEMLVAERVTTFLAAAGEECCAAFLDNLHQGFYNKKSIVYTEPFTQNVGHGVLKQHAKMMKKGVKRS